MQDRNKYLIKKIQNKDIRKEIRKILENYRILKNDPLQDKISNPFSTADGILRTDIYSLTRRAMRENLLVYIKNAVPADCQPQRQLAESPFAWTLSLIFNIIEPITRSRRNKIRLLTLAMDHAHDKRVPARFFIGFVHQIGGLKAIAAGRSSSKT